MRRSSNLRQRQPFPYLAGPGVLRSPRASQTFRCRLNTGLITCQANRRYQPCMCADIISRREGLLCCSILCHDNQHLIDYQHRN